MGLQATVIRDIILSSSSYGTAYDELCSYCGFTQEELSDSKLMVEWEKAAGIWDVLADMSGSEQIGLMIAAEMNISMNGMVGFLMQSSKTLEDAIEVYCQYGYMVCPMVPMYYRVEGEMAVIELHQNAMWKATYPRNARIAMDFTLACIVYISNQLVKTPVFPQSLSLEFDKMAIEVYKEIFKCNVSFNAPVYSLTYRRQDLLQPLVSSDKSLYEMFNGILSQQKTLKLQTSTSNALKQMLMMHFKGRIPTVEEAAASMNMTVRTLQRKLAEEQSSFRILTAEVKKEMALHLIRKADANITEVAEILGYSDLPAFRKAFKGWTKETPRNVKRQLQVSLAG